MPSPVKSRDDAKSPSFLSVSDAIPVSPTGAKQAAMTSSLCPPSLTLPTSPFKTGNSLFVPTATPQSTPHSLSSASMSVSPATSPMCTTPATPSPTPPPSAGPGLATGGVGGGNWSPVVVRRDSRRSHCSAWRGKLSTVEDSRVLVGSHSEDEEESDSEIGPSKSLLSPAANNSARY